MEAASTCTQCDAPAPAGAELCSSCRTASNGGSSSPASADDAANCSIDREFEDVPGERYEITGRLGTGAFGAVYKALDTFLHRTVAIKSIRLDTSLEPEHRAALNKRFLREAQVAAQLQHRNIVTIHDIMFTAETGFLVMEYIDGSTLQSLLKATRLPLTTSIDIAVQVAEALQYAHEHNIIHRDVKPGNIMITPSLEARIMDFGIAKSDGPTHLTISGSLVGTPDYMSPEQARGEDVDARSDLFSLGCVLYECVVGEKPFGGTSLTSVLLSIVNKNPLESEAWKSRNLPDELRATLARALAKQPSDRFGSAAELIEALRSIPASSLAFEGPRIDATEEPDPRPLIVPEEDLAAAGRMSDAELRALKNEERPIRFSPTLSDELQEMSLTPAQGFVLSRIDGFSRARDILAVSPMPELEVAETLADLIDKGLLTWAGDEPGPDSPPSGAPAAASEQEREMIELAEDLVREMEHLLELAEQKNHAELLGVGEDTSTADVKKAYLELIQRFHPNAHPPDLSEAARQKLSKLCAVATEALSALSGKRAIEPKPPPSEPPIFRSPPGFDRKKYAGKLYRLAQRAYEKTDYWEAIQLARQAIELDEDNAAYHHLLGLGLMKNKNWMREAEECLRKASEFDPTKCEHFAALATLYKSEGLKERAAAMTERAKALNPDFVSP